MLLKKLIFMIVYLLSLNASLNGEIYRAHVHKISSIRIKKHY